MLNLFARIVVKLSIFFGIVGMCASIFMMLLITTDIFLRYFFGQPIKGTFEITKFMLVIIFFFGFAYTQHQKSHISVDIVISILPPRAYAVLRSFSYFFYCGFISLITWQIFVYAMEAMDTGQVTPTLGISVFPFIFLAGFGSVVFCAVVLVDLLRNVALAVKK